MRYLRLLFWLKWKLMWRSYRRNTTALVGVILTILVFLPLALGLAFGVGIGFISLPPDLSGHLLRAVLLGIYLFWALSPLIGYALNDSYDITKLFLYPVSVRQILTGAIFGSVIDMPVLLLMPTLLAVMAGFTHDMAGLALIVMSVALFLFHTLSLSQSLILLSAGVLRSRRFRDAVMVAIPVIWMAYYATTQMLQRRALRMDWTAFLNSRAWDVAGYLPPGLAARAVASAGKGEYLFAVIWLLLLMAVTAVTVFLAAWLIQAVYAGEEVGPRRGSRAVQANARPGLTSPSPSGRIAPSTRRRRGPDLPVAVEAMAGKEVCYFLRDPYFKVALMNLVYMLLVGVFMLWRTGGESTSAVFGQAAIWGATAMILLSEMQLLFNIFGTEAGGAATLFLFPCSRLQIIVGKNLSIFVALSAVNVAVLLILSALAGMLSQFGLLLLWMELALLVFMGVGNIVSVWFPYRLTAQGWRLRQKSASQGCGYGFLYLGATAAAYVLLLPVAASLILPAFAWVPAAWFAATIPFACVYSAGLYTLSLRTAAPLLLQREADIIEKLKAPE